MVSSEAIMKQTGTFVLVLVTAPDLRTGRRIALAALRARLIACANLVPGIESHYWWKGRIDSAKEVLLVLKTTARRVAALEKLVLAEHPYETPEFVVVPFTGGSKRYLEWVEQSVTAPGGSK
jgi:periplasmic divalent cation tolerance protein